MWPGASAGDGVNWLHNNSRASEPNCIFWASDPILLTVFLEQKYVFFKLMFLNFARILRKNQLVPWEGDTEGGQPRSIP